MRICVYVACMTENRSHEVDNSYFDIFTAP